jgi:hypothetical protein
MPVHIIEILVHNVEAMFVHLTIFTVTAFFHQTCLYESSIVFAIIRNYA